MTWGFLGAEMKAAVALCFGMFLVALRGVQSQSCSPASNFEVTPTAPGTLEVNWIEDPSYSYLLQYTSSSDSNSESRDATRVPTVLDGLLDFTEYRVTLITNCAGRETVNQTLTVTTSLTKPSARPNSSTVVIISEVDPPLVNISWSPIPESAWNGVPTGYYVYISGIEEFYRAPYPRTHILLRLSEGRYAARIAAVNNMSVSDQVLTSEFFNVPTSNSSPSFVDYPYFYILIPGVLFLAIIVGIIIVIFKKLHERSKRSVTFVHGIESISPYSKGGFGNVLPMRDLSPNSPNNSASMPLSSTVTSPTFSMQQHNHHQHFANRPLPLSPDPILAPAEENFVAPVSSHPSMNRKLTHPGPLPMLEENVEQTNFVPMSRTMTDPNLGSVFSPVSATAPHHQMQQQQQQHMAQQHGRGRSNTLPSPYEVPDQNTPQEHVNSAHLVSTTSQRANRGATGGGSIPPPPAHSPPPLLHSPNDIIHMMDDPHRHQQPHPQHDNSGHTLPRTGSHQQRSFSTSAAQGRNVGVKGLSYMKSDGNIHETMLGGGGYHHHPGDSDDDPSVISGSSHGAASDSAGGHRQEWGRQPPPQSYHHKKQSRQQPRNPAMMNGALASSDQLGNFGAMGEGPIPPSYQLPPAGVGHETKRESLFSETSNELSMDGDHDKRQDSLYSESSGELPHMNPTHPAGRARNESVFSETSTEVSVSSSNRHSPGWGPVKSDVSHRGQRSKSPPERETFGDIGQSHLHHPHQNGFV